MLSTWGLGVVVGYRCADLMVPGTATSVFAGTEGGYFYGTYYRLPDGTVFSGTRGAFSPDDVGFNYWMVEWKSGLKQGFLSKGGHDFLGLELIYTGDWRHHVENEGALLFASSVPEKEGLLMHELRVSVFADYVLPHILHQYKEGMGAEVWFRMVPPGMGEGSGGTVSYYGVGGETKASFTVYDSDPEGDEFCVVLVTHALFEHMWGEHVPFFELGYATEYLRGVDGQGLDTPNSGVANAELRFYLPSPGLAFNLTIWPVLYVFSDNGYFWDEAFEEGVFVSSAGLGCALELAPVGVLSLSTQWRLTDTNVDGTRWSPLYLSLGSYLF
ncbi:hypothetical protein [Spirochaeta thermophila]|nr:hypothetical protein [Spirochaeta thermophila]